MSTTGADATGLEPCDVTRQEFIEVHKGIKSGELDYGVFFFKAKEGIPKRFQQHKEEMLLKEDLDRCNECGCTVAKHLRAPELPLPPLDTSGSHNTSNVSESSKADVLDLVATNQPIHPIRLANVDMKFTGRSDTMSAFNNAVAEVEKIAASKKSTYDQGKGQPIIATGATTGVGKSRLLEEVRATYIEKGWGVVCISYNTLENLVPSHKERDCSNLEQVTSSFLSRVACMLLPTEEFRKHDLATRFDLSVEDVEDILCTKFAGKNVLLLVDEIGTLGQDGTPDGDKAVFEVISVLGRLAHAVTLKNKKTCIAVFTALCEGLIESACTNSGRPIITIPLPLLSMADVTEIIRAAQPKASDVVIDHIFAVSAGHPRTVEAFLHQKWTADGTQPEAHTTLKAVLMNLQNIAKAPVGKMNETEVRCVLLESASAGVDFQVLSRRSIVHVVAATSSEHTRVVMVPAFLYQWAIKADNEFSHRIVACLEAAWERIFLSNEKEGTDGKTIESFLWHYEALRRDLLGDQWMTMKKFYRLCGKNDEDGGEQFLFPPIKTNHSITNPYPNTFSKFKVSQLTDSNARYVPTSSNFPKYDWFTVVKTKAGKRKVQGGQTKHGAGQVQASDKRVISVKFSTLTGARNAWEKLGWLVLDGNDLERYLGSTLSAASSPARYINSKRKRGSVEAQQQVVVSPAGSL